jgi:predicted Zn finger-like uncharacterized protein
MSLTTQCPRCHTTFLVTPEQLREAQGWVRCGICQEVFGALAHAAQQHAMPTDPPLALRQEGAAPHAAGLPDPVADASIQDGIQRGIQLGIQGGVQDVQTVFPTPKRRTAWILSLLSASLVVLLLGQLGLHQRNHLAAEFPRAAAWVQSACGDSDACSLRDIEPVAIAESSFEAIDTNHFKLSAAITNRSVLRLEAPSLALALTDSADRVLARKSFAPAQWGAQASALNGQATWPVALWIEFELPADSAPVVGYRLTAFYP